MADAPAPLQRRRGRSALPPYRLRRITLVLGMTLVLLATLATTGGVVLLRRFDSVVAQTGLLAPDARNQPGAALVGPLNFVLIGSDKRAGNPSAGQRSDTIIVAHVTRKLDRAFLISVPRDLLVDIPPDPAANFGGSRTKINAAFEYGKGGAGGIQLLSQTLTNLIGIRFDAAAVLEFSGLTRAVDVLGGVRMCVDERTVSIHTRRVFEPGCRMMNSAEVLDYLRQRHFSDGDFARQRHQQQFVKAFLAQATASGLINNPVRLDGLLHAVGSAMTLDTGGYSLADLAYGLRGVRPETLTGIKIPAAGQSYGNLSVVVPTGDAASLFEAVRADTLDAWAASHPQWVNRI